ncbi:MAG: OmcA/MtrC family decaheme c-type cytochrome [Betaproteobacteria bacterium]|nr:OmcA/MtrC family decaheme c-type cytochrome [Betaproteobacteria bacterium]
MHTQSGKWKGWSLLATTLVTAAFLLQGCGGSDGSAGPAGPAGATGATGATGAPGKDLTNTVSIPSNSGTATDASSAAWKALAPQVTVTGVTIASAPVVKFTVKDANGNPIVGLGNKSQSATASVPVLTNIAFTLAKLVPGSNGAPSKWVSYNVLRPPTVAEKAGTVAATTSCDSTTAPTWCGTYPTTDTQGTLVDNGDGSYQYTFYRDPKQVATLAAKLIDTANGLNKKADLGDLTFDASLTHRLGIQLGGNAPGTGSNTPNAVTVTPAVAMVNTANVVYDFRPDGGAKSTTREITKIDACGGCHEGQVLAHGSRKDPNYCVTCHTDQIKYSFSMEAPATGLTLTGGTTGTTAQKRAETAVVDGRAIGNFPNFIHKLHMGSRLIKQGYNYNANGGAMMFNTVKYPQDVLNCTKCHDGSASAANKTADGDNWKSVPSRLACGACHDGINFATGQGTTAAKATTGHIGGAKADDAQCVLCHDATTIPVYHSEKMPSTADAAKRTMSATITKVTVGATDGSVNVTFKVTDNGVAVTDMTKFTKPSFGLVKLVPAANGEGSHWVSYTSRFRTKSATMAPVLQASNENAGTLTANADGTFNYKFALLTASTEGDIRTVTHAHNVSTIAPYATTNWTGAGATIAGTGLNAVAYEPTLTHRVAMTFQKVGTTNVDNATNATFDFVPAGGTVTSTRNIVTMNNCATCHAGGKLHSGYATEYCVTCHNQGTFDPYTAETVDFQRLVHKVHMGADLPSVKAGGTYVINGAHDYTTAVFPGNLKNCANACHKQTATKVGSTTLLENRANWETTPTSRACGACHDSATASAHIASQINAGVETCAVCHAPGAVAAVKEVHSK